MQNSQFTLKIIISNLTMRPNQISRTLVVVLLTSLLSACGAGSAFDKARQTNTVIAYDQFLREYSDSEYASEARELRKDVFFAAAEAEASGSFYAYEDYLQKYIDENPDSELIDAVREKLYNSRRTILWRTNKSFRYGEKFINAYKTYQRTYDLVKDDVPLYYFVYLYTQAAAGQYIGGSHYPPEPLAPKIPAITKSPQKPKLNRGEFETSTEFGLRQQKALQDWQSRVAKYNSNLSELRSAYEQSLSIRQDLLQEYEDEIKRRRAQVKDPEWAIKWQKFAVQAVISSGLDLGSLQYDADQQVFEYKISSSRPSLAWQGQLVVPVEKARRFKSNWEKKQPKLQFSFYLNPTGSLELKQVTDLVNNLEVNTQNTSLQPTWFPSVDLLAQLSLLNLSLSSNIHADEVLINGIDFGPAPTSLLLPTGTYELQVYAAQKPSYNMYSDSIELQSNENRQISLRRNTNPLSENIKNYIGFEHNEYTKLDMKGNPLSSNASEWSCVRDNYSGLVWEVKKYYRTYSGDVYGPYDRYKWSIDSATQALEYEYEGNNQRSESYWNSDLARDKSRRDDYPSDTLVDIANRDEFCGFTDWRLPELHELATLVRCAGGHYANLDDGCSGAYQSPTINEDYFPGTLNYSYLSSSGYMDDSTIGFSKYRYYDYWTINFRNGADVLGGSPIRLGHVRLVRSSR